MKEILRCLLVVLPLCVLLADGILLAKLQKSVRGPQAYPIWIVSLVISLGVLFAFLLALGLLDAALSHRGYPLFFSWAATGVLVSICAGAQYLIWRLSLWLGERARGCSECSPEEAAGGHL